MKSNRRKKSRRNKNKPSRSKPRQDCIEVVRGVLTARRKTARPALIAETARLVEAGVGVETILWLLSPEVHGACVANASIEDFRRRGAPDLAQQLEVFQSCLCSRPHRNGRSGRDLVTARERRHRVGSISRRSWPCVPCLA